MNKYLAKSWVSEKLEMRNSSIHGMGVFAKAPITKGEIVIIWGGTIVSVDDFKQGLGLKNTNVGIDENLFLVTNNSDEMTIDDFMNHSCEPNLWLKDEVTLIANRAIEQGEELTIDYAIELVDEDYIMKNPCYCKTNNCRNIITGKDWRLMELQNKYLNHFSPFILKRIKNLQL